MLSSFVYGVGGGFVISAIFSILGASIYRILKLLDTSSY